MEKEIIINPSMLSADFYNIENDIKVLYKNNIKYLHMDVMDGIFVKNISYGIPVIKSIVEGIHKNNMNFIIDTHLMIEHPIEYVKEFKNCGSDILSIHFESKSDIIDTIEKIREYDMKPSLTINPDTEVEKIYKYLHLVDQVLIMSVYPGFGGQKFIEGTFNKIKLLNDYKKKHYLQFDIEVDGGVNEENTKELINTGANVLVMGSTIFKNGMIEENILQIKQKISEVSL